MWKSKNQGDKEDTFIQTSRRGGNRQPGRNDSQQDSGWRTRAGEMAAGRPREAADCGVGQARLQVVDLAIDCANPGLQHGEIKPQATD